MCVGIKTVLCAFFTISRQKKLHLATFATQMGEKFLHVHMYVRMSVYIYVCVKEFAYISLVLRSEGH